MRALLRRVMVFGGLGVLGGAVYLPAVSSPAPPPKLHYNRDIRPILSENCFLCHGPDRNARKANLRLDVRESALARGAFVPGNSAKSRIIARVFAKGGMQMPPASSHKQLTPTQKAVLKRWVEEGAVYEKHWAFAPLPKQVAVPAVKNGAWVRSPIDRFVLAELERSGLTPSPPADRSAWLRRASFDLTGLPPTVTEQTAFLSDRSPKAFESAVDRLLASPHFGEQMAVAWLDIARYADSYGYQSDQLSPTYPYRDWVVGAFNANMPYSTFLKWQVAGDLMPNATRESRLATAFNRLHRMTNEGGSVSEEWRMEGVADRIRTFGTAFLGLTFECARCHDHKYDPVSQRDYYSLAAFFNSIDEYGMYDSSGIVPSPSLLLPTPDQERTLTEAQKALGEAERRVLEVRNAREPAFREWLKSPSGELLPEMLGRFDFEKFEGAVLPNRVPGAKGAGARFDEVPLVAGKVGKAGQFDGENNVNFPELGRFTRHTPYTIAFWFKDARIVKEPVVLYQGNSGTDSGFHGYDLMLEQGVLSARMYRHLPGNAIGVRAKGVVPANMWTHVAVTYDGSSRAAGLKIYVNGALAESDVLHDRMVKGTGIHTLTFGQRFRDRGFKGGLIDEISLFGRSLAQIEVAQLFDGRSLQTAMAKPAENEAVLRERYFSAVDAEVRAATLAVEGARARLVQAEDPIYEIAVMEEMPKPRAAFVLSRGRYDAPKTEANRVGRAIPAVFGSLSSRVPKDRLALVDWLLQPNHPLTARVAVNRLWGQLFGRGLVETTEDFGIQGRLPSHPELLDWLARDFVRSGWDIKALVKQLVLSSVYRQSSALRPDLKARDPQNILLGRAPSYRLSAETIRDTALAASGLLDRRLGGSPASPYMPGDLWRESNSMSQAYSQKDVYRRSLYTVIKRTAPMPNMIAFDATGREVCVARRQTTNTPLQAFVLLNDPQFVEASRVLGERMLKEGGATLDSQIGFVFRSLTGRAPDAREAQLLLRLFAMQREEFMGKVEQAKQLVAIGDSKADPALSVVDLAAATVVAQTILNLDATIWKR